MTDPRQPPAPQRGRLWVLTAPSGAGKTTLVRRLLERRPQLVFSVSSTTRAPRPGERDGHDYFFVTPEEFRRKVDAGGLLEHAEVFGNHYGTDRRRVEDQLESGHDVLLEIDWQGARQVRARMPEAVLVFIMPPSLAELERRLRGRGTDDAAVVARRLACAQEDMSRWPEFDYVIVNDELAAAVEQLMAVMDGREVSASTRDEDLRTRLQGITGLGPGPAAAS